MSDSLLRRTVTHSRQIKSQRRKASLKHLVTSNKRAAASICNLRSDILRGNPTLYRGKQAIINQLQPELTARRAIRNDEFRCDMRKFSYKAAHGRVTQRVNCHRFSVNVVPNLNVKARYRTRPL